MRYEPVIGMEVHAELATVSKCFCACSTVFGAPPNTQTCPVCLGLPGSLPVLNRMALEFVLRTAVAMNCDVTRDSQFERKNYYYPDLPKNFQISQLRTNLGVDGFLDIPVGDKVMRVGIDNVHLEEDPGKLAHSDAASAEYSLVDLNRSGTPLIEIVTKPDMRSSAEAMGYMQTLKNLLQYIEVCDCKMEQGSLRFECNVSVRLEGSDELRTRVEIKNLNSMKTAIKTIEYEIKRQTKAYESGKEIAQETRLWDEEASVTRSMRSKEHAHDYRYFPEPDLPWIHVTDPQLDEIKGNLPELSGAKRARFAEQYGLPEYAAEILTRSRPLADYFEQAVAAHDNAKSIGNWIMTELLRELGDRDLEIEDCPISAANLADMVKMIDDSTISGKIAKTVFVEMIESGDDPKKIVEAKGLVQVTDTGEIEGWVDQAIEANTKAADQFREGKDKAIGALVGFVMKASRGKANPQLVNDLLRKKLRG